MAIYNPGSQKAVKWTKQLVCSLNSAFETEIQFLAPEGGLGRAIPPCTHSCSAPLYSWHTDLLSTERFPLPVAFSSSTWANPLCICMVCCHCCLLCRDTNDSAWGHPSDAGRCQPQSRVPHYWSFRLKHHLNLAPSLLSLDSTRLGTHLSHNLTARSLFPHPSLCSLRTLQYYILTNQ